MYQEFRKNRKLDPAKGLLLGQQSLPLDKRTKGWKQYTHKSHKHVAANKKPRKSNRTWESIGMFKCAEPTELLNQLKQLRQESAVDPSVTICNERQLQIAVKQLQRRSQLGPFKAHRKKHQSYKRYETDQIYKQQCLDEDEGPPDWRTCFQPEQIEAQRDGLKCQNLQELVYTEKPRVAREGNSVLKDLVQRDMAEYQWLIFSKAQIPDVAISYISTGMWSGLTVLDLGQNNISNFGCRYLASADLPKLQQLNLGKNQITPEGVSHLSKANWPWLILIALNGAGGLSHIMKGDFKYLRDIYVDEKACSFRELMLMTLKETKPCPAMKYGPVFENSKGVKKRKFKQTFRMFEQSQQCKTSCVQVFLKMAQRVYYHYQRDEEENEPNRLTWRQRYLLERMYWSRGFYLRFQ